MTQTLRSCNVFIRCTVHWHKFDMCKLILLIFHFKLALVGWRRGEHLHIHMSQDGA